jgi:hypothetical protein
MQDQHSAAYRQEVRTIRLEDKEEMAGWAREDRTKSSTIMTHNFNVNAYQIMVELLANTASFIIFMVSDKDMNKSMDLPFQALLA